MFLPPLFCVGFIGSFVALMFSCLTFPSWQQLFRKQTLNGDNNILCLFFLTLLLQLAFGVIFVFLSSQCFNFPHLFCIISSFSIIFFILLSSSCVLIFHAISSILSVNSTHEIGLLNIVVIYKRAAVAELIVPREEQPAALVPAKDFCG